ncbi:MAG: outer membrane protein assembly factor BamE [Pseudomonadota bacterium]
MKISSKILTLSCIATLSFLAACTPVTAIRGNLLEDYQLKEVVPGIDSREDVTRKIGSPTTIAPFDDKVWYYMGQKTAKKGIMDAKITTERIVIVSFLDDGKVDKVIERKQGREDIPIVQRTTPAAGTDFTLLQQMMGNLGKFNGAQESAAKTAGGSRP